MTITLIDTIRSCSTTSLFDKAAALSDDRIAELVRIGTTAPTSFNFQNWRFVAVRTPEGKAKLRTLAWDQPKVTEAALTFIICGQLIDYSVLPERLAPAVAADIMPGDMVAGWTDAAKGLYAEQPQRQRDEAVRSGAIGATALIYAAHALDGMWAMMKRGKVEKRAADAKANPDVDYDYAYRTLDRFAVTVKAPDAKKGEAPTFVFERRGLFLWKMIRLEIPEDVFADRAR